MSRGDRGIYQGIFYDSEIWEVAVLADFWHLDGVKNLQAAEIIL